MTSPDVLQGSLSERAKAALQRHAWREAFDLLVEADALGQLSPHELGLLADAAWWVGQLPISIGARERAYAGYVKAGEPAFAAGSASKLAHDHMVKNSFAIAAAWLNRAERLVADLDETLAHGWVAAARSLYSLLSGDLDAAYRDASRALDIGTRLGDRDLQAFALNSQGHSLVAKGDSDRGLALLEEATVAAVAGELEPFTAGQVYCATIGACASVGDWNRAAQWTEAQDRWCEREQINGFPGMCRLHRAEIKQFRGAWLEAETEARRAADELASYIPQAVGQALYSIGEIRLRRGDLPAAEEALVQAHAMGRDPEPALSLLRLAEGKVEAAALSIARALDQPSTEPSWVAPQGTSLFRVGLLPAQVEIALAAGDVDRARAAADELEALAERFSSLAITASAACARGAVRLSDGEVEEAIRDLRHGLDLWSELDAPYEAARCRMLLAEAYLRQGDAARAGIEWQAARDAFEELGAILDVRRAEGRLAEASDPGRSPAAAKASRRRVMTFMFTDMVDSTRLVELLGDGGWDHLSRWHDQTMRSLISEHGGEEIKTIGDGFFVAFQRPASAIECAVSIQRRLAEHRQASGFAPGVRIGIHRAEASRRGLDYAGKGVNVAARIGAAAGGGEILASLATAEAASLQVHHSDPRMVELKGVAEPVEVVAIYWR